MVHCCTIGQRDTEFDARAVRARDAWVISTYRGRGVASKLAVAFVLLLTELGLQRVRLCERQQYYTSSHRLKRPRATWYACLPHGEFGVRILVGLRTHDSSNENFSFEPKGAHCHCAYTIV